MTISADKTRKCSLPITNSPSLRFQRAHTVAGGEHRNSSSTTFRTLQTTGHTFYFLAAHLVKDGPTYQVIDGQLVALISVNHRLRAAGLEDDPDLIDSLQRPHFWNQATKNSAASKPTAAHPRGSDTDFFRMYVQGRQFAKACSI